MLKRSTGTSYKHRVKRQNINEKVDLMILGKDSFKEIKKLKLSNILDKIANVKVESISKNLSVYKIKRPNDKYYKVYRDNLNIKKIFNKNYFLGNFKIAFDYDFNIYGENNQQANHTIKLFPHIKVLIDQENMNSNDSNISVEELSNFRFLTCMFFGLIYNISLDHCECHPSSFRDFVLLDAGIGKNCISGNCKQILEKYANYFDPFIHFECANTHYENLIFTFLNLASGGDINLKIDNYQNKNNIN